MLTVLLLVAGFASSAPAAIPRPSKYVSIDYSTIDAYARNTPESEAKTLDKLSRYLTAPARTDLAKARSVYSWIASHVRYDESAFQGRMYSSETAYASRVLSSRKAVCTGFALLYKELMNRAGIETANIKGYARTNDFESGMPITRVDHEWNAVKLDGDWFLLDLAWAQSTAKVPGTPNDFYFLTDPVPFSANHFPVDSRWQLLDKPTSKTQFDRYPKVYDAYFRLGLDTDFPQEGLLRSGETLTLSLRSDQPVEFSCAIGPYNGTVLTSSAVSVRQSGNVYQLSIPISRRGKSTVCLFAKPKGKVSERIKSYEGILSFTVARD
ncbi:transglutaminase domain-containing protein [Spirosoma rhododendri]|uniref:transglutaminase domain-containing protein n=1 Tax=Spirosoma rhododendri TaxID=2728024 RepID=UPI0020C1C45A|nr:transglutaminase domain-containing protein [Spirosoma rhododendri]